MTPRSTLVVVGAGLAGAKAAEGARQAGFDGRIVIVGDEPTAPYERPPLSKSLLRGESDLEAARVHPAEFYAQHEIELVVDRAVAFDLIVRRIELASGAAIDFDHTVIATGAAPRPVAVAGAQLEGVHQLRTVDDALRLRDAIGGASRVAVLGGGWIGSEVAASIRQMTKPVVLIDRAHVPLQRVLGNTIGEVFRELHADNGVDLRLGTTVAGLRGSKNVEAVILGDGRVEEADVVVVGIGVTPRIELAKTTSALQVDNGIVVDEHLDAGVPGVYAAGDVANAWHPHYQRHLRVEHWANALNQGLIAGGNAVGKHDPYTRLPYFFSDQYDVGLEYVGYADAGDTVVVRGDLAARQFVAFWHRDGMVTAAMHLNVWGAIDDLKRIVEARAVIDTTRLQNVDVPLEELVA
jgi:3-phenylpropionate/trans-cinnamate dioxygenase ferredoxin reductase subunit